jgi:hypothetical protein
VITPEKTDTAIEKHTVLIPAQPETLIKAAYWPWISLALAVGWLITLMALLRKGGRKPKTKPMQAIPLAPLEKTVRQSCAQSDAHLSKNALLEWAKARWPETTIASLVDIAELTNTELGEQLQALNTALYSPDHEQWNGAKLAKAFDGFLRLKIKHDNISDNALEPLYKKVS